MPLGYFCAAHLTRFSVTRFSDFQYDRSRRKFRDKEPCDNVLAIMFSEGRGSPPPTFAEGQDHRKSCVPLCASSASTAAGMTTLLFVSKHLIHSLKWVKPRAVFLPSTVDKTPS